MMFHPSVIPAKAGIQGIKAGSAALDPRLRGGDAPFLDSHSR
jgi:hypothetical protein